MKWEKPDRAKTYHYQIFKKQKGKWVLVEEQKEHNTNKAPFDLSRPPGKYRVSVQAHAPYTQSSKVARLQFRAAGNLRSPAAVNNAILKDSIEKPTNWYGIASYFITSMSYKGKEHVESGGEGGSLDAIGGTGRLGLGYQSPKRKDGYYGVIDLSGFAIKDDNGKSMNPTFASMELHYTYDPWKKKNNNSSQKKFTGGF